MSTFENIKTSLNSDHWGCYLGEISYLLIFYLELTSDKLPDVTKKRQGPWKETTF